MSSAAVALSFSRPSSRSQATEGAPYPDVTLLANALVALCFNMIPRAISPSGWEAVIIAIVRRSRCALMFGSEIVRSPRSGPTVFTQSMKRWISSLWSMILYENFVDRKTSPVPPESFFSNVDRFGNRFADPPLAWLSCSTLMLIDLGFYGGCAVVGCQSTALEPTHLAQP